MTWPCLIIFVNISDNILTFFYFQSSFALFSVYYVFAVKSLTSPGKYFRIALENF